MTRLRLIREPTLNDATLGSLYLNGVWMAWTLEDAIRDVKIYGQTAIPAGDYLVTLYFSPKRHRLVPLLHDVPNFDMIEIHIGNSPSDTDGCILVGFQRANAAILSSTSAFEALMGPLMRARDASDEIRIRIENPSVN